jgi:hypothetical protein
LHAKDHLIECLCAIHVLDIDFKPANGIIHDDPFVLRAEEVVQRPPLTGP